MYARTIFAMPKTFIARVIRLVLGLAPVFLLVSCGEQSGMEDAIRNQLKDPASAKFKEPVISRDGRYACIAWNAKNSLGGYGDWQYTGLKKGNSSWIVSEIQKVPDYCTSEYFALRDENRKLFEDIKKSAAVPRNLIELNQKVLAGPDLPPEMLLKMNKSMRNYLDELAAACRAYPNPDCK